MCGASVNPAPALSAATVFNLISLLCCAIAAGAPWYTYKSNSSSGTLSVGLFSFTSDKLILKSDGSFWSGPVSYKEYYDNVLSSACASAVSAVTCTAFKSALTTLTNLASASGALFIIGIFLSLLALCFTSLAAYNKSKRIDPPQGSCGARSSHCAASVVPIVFAFICAIVGVIIGSIGCLVSFILLGGAAGSLLNSGTISNGAGVVCAAISVVTTLISLIVDSSARCCCQKAVPGGVASGGTTVVVVNNGSPGYAHANPYAQAHPYAQEQAHAYAIAAPMAQIVAPPPNPGLLPPGWSQQSDASGAVWYVGPTGESQWEAPKA